MNKEKKKNCYYINEYSLDNQFSDIPSFISSVKDHTIPLLDKIQRENDACVFKKNDLWCRPICQGKCWHDIVYGEKERYPLGAFRKRLLQLLCAKPYFPEGVVSAMKIKKLPNGVTLKGAEADNNCFSYAVFFEADILSFMHDEFPGGALTVCLEEGGEKEVWNLSSLENWRDSQLVYRWLLPDNGYVEVRSRERAYHAPHFHVKIGEYENAYLIKNGETIHAYHSSLARDCNRIVQQWYCENKEYVECAWNDLHPSRL